MTLWNDLATGLVILAELFLVLSFAITILLIVYRSLRFVFRPFLVEWWNTRLYFTDVHWKVEDFLNKHFRFYQSLPDDEKVTFAKRVQKFINMKDFQGREGLVITSEMQTLVAAIAIQITYGFPGVYLRYFQKIVLYPDVYLSPFTHTYNRGEVNSTGVIILSWNNLVKGYLTSGDGRNLGLHEMAHALKIANAVATKESDFLEPSIVRQFVMLAREEMYLIENGEDTFFRSYAASNDDEFFAVAVENFFEKPGSFSAQKNQMFNVLVRLLNQKP